MVIALDAISDSFSPKQQESFLEKQKTSFEFQLSKQPFFKKMAGLLQLFIDFK